MKKIRFLCEECKDEIEPGDEYVTINGCDYHIECLELMSTRELLEALGHEVKTMEEDYGEYC